MTDEEKLTKAKARIGILVSVYDEEITDLLADAKKDMIAAGVPESAEQSESFFNAQMLYVRAWLGNDRADTNRYMAAYREKVFRLALEEGGT
ncbi:MAG: hypothetical protein J6N19_08125 [Clostridium sp.]|nr:hypothetical protein [Clostridium sp.]